jgi:putative tricarboxylic transport membrane protein
MTRADRWSGPALLVLSLYVSIESWRLGLGTYFRPGSGFFPFYSGLLLGVLAVILTLGAFRGELEPGEAWGKWTNILLVSVGMLGFVLLLNRLGFLLTAFLFIGFLLQVVERRDWIVSLGAAALTALASYAIFQLWLRAQLPAGILGR